jgi:acyl-CoA dehydrogenase
VDFSISPHIEDLRRRVRRFIDEEVIPLERYDHAHEDGLPPELLNEVRQKAKAEGLWLPQLPKEWGGLGLNLQEIIPVFETAGRSLLGPLVLNASAPDEGNMHLLELAGTEEQKEEYLRPLANGEIRSAFAMTEPAPGAGSDPKMIKTTAVRDGDEWIINGHKWFATGGDGAAFLLIMAVTDPNVDPRRGSTIFLSPVDVPGIEFIRRVPIMGANVPGGHAEFEFHDLRVPHDAILGETGAGFALAQQRLGPARLTHCMRWLGIAQRAMEIATEYAAKREAFGDKLIGHQAIQWMLADSKIEIHASRLMIHHAGWLLAQGDHARTETSMTKTYTAETVWRVLDRAVQICGATGISRDLPLSTWMEEARAFRIYDGPSEVHRRVTAWSVIKSYAG